MYMFNTVFILIRRGNTFYSYENVCFEFYLSMHELTKMSTGAILQHYFRNALLKS